MKAVTVDIDGTLANITHRLHLVNEKRDWNAFFEEMVNDSVNEHVAEVVEALSQRNYYIILVSGRPDNYRTQTEDWLDDNEIFYDFLYMREAGDYRRDDVVKNEILDQIEAAGFVVEMAIDDRESVIKNVWQANDIPVLQIPSPQYNPKHETTLNILVGPSGSGKTTYARTYLDQTMILSSDNFREIITKDFKDQSQNSRVFDALHRAVQFYLREGLDVTVDATNLRNRDRKAVAKLATPSTKVVYFVIDRPMPEKVDDRGWRPVWLLEKHQNTFNSNIKDILKGDGIADHVWDLRANV